MPFVIDGQKRGVHCPPSIDIDPSDYRPSRSHWFSSRCSGAFNRALNYIPGRRILNKLSQRGTELREVEVSLQSAHSDLDGYCIAFISDVHVGSFMDEVDLHRIFARIGEHEPDLVCLGGDLINTQAKELLAFTKPIESIRPTHGVYAVPGNHEHSWGAGMDHWRQTMEGMGVTALFNQGNRIENGAGGFWLCGVDDLCEGNPDLDAALQGRNSDDPVILLSHNPDYYVEAAAKAVDLTIAGHTHGGQILFFGWTPLGHSRHGYWKGLHSNGRSALYVSRGVGVSILPLRLGARPEISILRLRTTSPGD
ncbi:MAG: metallophosphoesterase [Planctomycetota bacterium]|jgi:predicted MPP superfamily phosphohydrolase